jgi:hypothetical protein
LKTSDNPFDECKTKVGLRNKNPLDRRQRERQRKLGRIEKEKDADIKRELRKGNAVEVIEDG